MTKIVIRPLQHSDHHTSWKWRNDPDIWQFTGSRPDVLVDEATELLWIEQVLAQPDSMRYAICDAATDEYIGNVQITHINNGVGEFHIFIGNKDYWGKGVGSQATRLMLQEAFTAGLHLIYLHVHQQNKPAIAIYERCGFVATNIGDCAMRMEIERSSFYQNLTPQI